MVTIIRSSEGDLLDTLCYAHYGHLNGTVEAVLRANPGLSTLPQPYPAGVTLRFPELAAARSETIHLWS